LEILNNKIKLDNSLKRSFSSLLCCIQSEVDDILINNKEDPKDYIIHALPLSIEKINDKVPDNIKNSIQNRFKGYCLISNCRNSKQLQ
jgi:hypothetical protein